MASLEGRVLGGRYQIESRLGSGGMGTVYAAIHLDLARPVAVKVLDRVGSPKDRERFAAEALAAACLSNPHIVQVTDYVAETRDEPAFLVMERLHGQSLSTYLDARGALSPALAVHIAAQLLDALGAAHAVGIIHRDVKPENIVVLDGGEHDQPWIKLIDFGIAKIADLPQSKTTTGIVLGTLSYLAPEIVRGGRATKESDFYSVGLVLYEMVSGKKASALAGRAPPAGERPLADVVAKATARDPAKRFHVARDMIAALREVDRSPPRRSHAFVVPLVVTVLAGAVVASVAIVSKRRATVVTEAAAPAPVVSPTSSSEVDAALVEQAADASVDASITKASNLRRSSCVVIFKGVPMRGEALCALPIVYGCNCLQDGYPTYSTPNLEGPAIRESRTDGRGGDTCSGYADRGGAPVFAKGVWQCTPNCDNARRKMSERLAVPGTPCTGWIIDQPESGVWKAIDDGP